MSINQLTEKQLEEYKRKEEILGELVSALREPELNMQTTEEYLQTCLDRVANRLRHSLDRERKLKEKVAELESGSMSLKLAICELRKYNEWRRSPKASNPHSQPKPNPIVVGNAIDTVVDYHSSRIEWHPSFEGEITGFSK